MDDLFQISDFLDPVNLGPAFMKERFRDGQLGLYIEANEGELPSFREADIVLVGCGERRGDVQEDFSNAGPDAVRRSLYTLYQWHRQLRIADAGNIRQGEQMADTMAALRSVVSEIIASGARAVIIGGSHDLTLAQYEVYRQRKQIIEAVVVDAYIDLSIDIPTRSRNFLMEILTGEPNFIRNYSHLAFQSYLVHPNMLETMDKLRFDCFRIGHMREAMDEMEPVLRASSMLSFDMAALQHAAAPGSSNLPNGLNGEEACLLMQYAGMSDKLNTVGIYGTVVDDDPAQRSAQQAAQMIWYFMDGLRKGRLEVPLTDVDDHNVYHTAFAEVETTFLQSRRTGRWWMQMPDGNYIPCSQGDYRQAAQNDLPERWIRAQERS